MKNITCQLLKQGTVLLLAMGFALSGFAQERQTEIKDYKYFEQSAVSKRKTAKKLLILGGSTMIAGTVGTIITTSNYNDDWDDDHSSGEVGAMVLSVGAIAGGWLCSMGSIPLFIVSGHHKRKAAELAPTTGQVVVNNRAVNTVGIKLNF